METETFEEVLSSDFSERSTSDSESSSETHPGDLSSDGEVDSETITRDFWVKKEHLRQSKKHRLKQSKKEKRSAERKAKKRALLESRKTELLHPSDVVFRLSKHASFRLSNKIDQLELIKSLQRSFEATPAFGPKALVATFLFEAVSFVFDFLDAEKPEWLDMWCLSMRLIKTLGDCLDENVGKRMEEMEGLLSLFGETEEDEGSEKLYELSEKQKAKFKSRLSSETFNHLFSIFFLNLSDAIHCLGLKLRIQNQKTHSKLQEELIIAAKRAKETFSKAFCVAAQRLISRVLFQNMFQRYQRNHDCLNTSPNHENVKFEPQSDISARGEERKLGVFSRDGFERNCVEQLAIVAFWDGKEYQKIETALKLSIYWSIHNMIEKAEKILHSVAEKIAAEGGSERLVVLFNRAKVFAAVGWFKRGDYRRASEDLETFFMSENPIELLGQNIKNPEHAPSLLLSYNTLKTIHYISSIFSEAVSIAWFTHHAHPCLCEPRLPWFRQRFRQDQKGSLNLNSGFSAEQMAFRFLERLLRAEHTESEAELNLALLPLSSEVFDFDCLKDSLTTALRTAALKVYFLEAAARRNRMEEPCSGAVRGLSLAVLARRFSLTEEKVEESLQELVFGEAVNTSESEKVKAINWRGRGVEDVDLSGVFGKIKVNTPPVFKELVGELHGAIDVCM